VAASTSQGARSSFSNYGSAVDVTAPGSSICAMIPPVAATSGG
jgi:serine protease